MCIVGSFLAAWLFGFGFGFFHFFAIKLVLGFFVVVVGLRFFTETF